MTDEQHRFLPPEELGRAEDELALRIALRGKPCSSHHWELLRDQPLTWPRDMRWICDRCGDVEITSLVPVTDELIEQYR